MVRTWSVPDFKSLPVTPEQKGAIKRIAFVPDSATVIVAERIDDFHIEYSAWRNGQPVWPHFANGFRGHFFALSPDGSAFATANGGATGGKEPGEFVVRLRSTQTGEPLLPEMKHIWSVGTPAFHPSGKILASPGHDHTVRIWNLESGQQIGMVHTEDRFENRYSTCCFSRDGKYLIVGGVKGVQTWQLDPLQPVTRVIPLELYPNSWIALLALDSRGQGEPPGRPRSRAWPTPHARSTPPSDREVRPGEQLGLQADCG